MSTITLSYTNSFQPINDHNRSSNESLRIHSVSVRFNKKELELLNANRGSKGEWLRLTSLDQLPVIVPVSCLPLLTINIYDKQNTSYLTINCASIPFIIKNIKYAKRINN